MKVLIGVDGSDRSMQSVKFASQILSPEHDQISLVFAPPSFSIAGQAKESDVHQLARDAIVDAVFKKAQAQLPAAFANNVSTQVVEGRAVDGVLQAAEDYKASLIVVGAHGATRRLSFFVGGTARGVVQRANHPVLVVRGDELPKEQPFRVLIATGGDNVWKRSIETLNRFHWPEGTESILFHVVEIMDEDHYGALLAESHPSVPNAEALVAEFQSLASTQRANCMDQLTEVKSGMPPIISDAKIEIGQGHVVEQIVHRVKEDKIDLLVVGAHRKGPLRRLLGSTSEGLLHQCPCSLLICHEYDEH